MILGSGRSPGKGKALLTPVFWPVEWTEAWQATVQGVAKNCTRPSDFHFTNEVLLEQCCAIFILNLRILIRKNVRLKVLFEKRHEV